MRRNAELDLSVDTDVAAVPRSKNEKNELTQSPSIHGRPSFDSESSSSPTVKDVPTLNTQAPSTSPSSPPQSQPQPSIRLLFSLLPRRDFFSLVLPAISTSLIAGGVAPFMTIVVGQTFDAFANFPVTQSSSTPEQRSQLRHDVGIAAVELVALAAGALALSSITSALWISTGERNVMRLRHKVFDAVTSREMAWFDVKMGTEDSVVSTGDDGPVGAGGLMAKFARETDDVRMASSLASGTLIQYLTTCIAALAIAFSRSWSLTLVILSAVPLLIFIQSLSQRFAGPLVAAERTQTARAAALATRALSAITTVKAFNAQPFELSSLLSILQQGESAATRVNAVWGATSALAQTTTMAMFVQGFWFGASLVRKGSVSAGDVMAVFWACLIATSNLQMCIPQLITLTKGKFAMASLLALIETPTPTQQPPSPSPFSPEASSRKTLSILSGSTGGKSHLTLTSSYQLKTLTSNPQPLRKIRPVYCKGELALANVFFAYPSRPSAPVLQDVSLYFPARETTFVVGGSGSGKSTVSQLLNCLYAPYAGSVSLDEQDVRFLDESWVRRHVAVVSQTCVLFEGTVHENVAMGVSGSGERKPEDVRREEVVDVCTRALLHEFVRDLPDGYDTRLGAGGASLSGGQKQRLALARAMLRDPTVLVLDEATSALDATSRVLVFEAIRLWRRDKTTIVITHDLSQITGEDFVYVLKDGQVAEQGYRSDLESSVTPSPFGDNVTGDEGEFRQMMRAQGGVGGFPVKELEDEEEEVFVEDIIEDAEEAVNANTEVGYSARTKHQSVGINWMLDVVQDLTRSRAPTPSVIVPPVPSTTTTNRVSKHLSFNPPQTTSRTLKRLTFEAGTLPSSNNTLGPSTTSRKSVRRKTLKRAISLQFIPASPTTAQLENESLEKSGAEAMSRRIGRPKVERTRWTDVSLDEVKVDSSRSSSSSEATSPKKAAADASIIGLFRSIYPSVPNKGIVALGLLACAASGAMTPLFSFLLSKLLFQVSAGATNTRAINALGGVVLAVATADGVFMGLKFFLMETGAQRWLTAIRRRCYELLLAQDASFFDAPSGSSQSTNTGNDKNDNNEKEVEVPIHAHAPARLVQTLIKDGDDARNLIAVVLGQFVVVFTMLSVGLLWALIQGWQLTLAGLAIGPVFAITMAVQANLSAKCERRNKAAREDIAKAYFDAIANVRAVRCMSLEGVFEEKFGEAVEEAYRTGVRGAFVEGATYGVASGLIYLAEALLFYVGAVLVAQGTYTYLQMVEVLNLVVFTVSIGSQLMQFTQKIAKATTATRDFNKLLSLSPGENEFKGTLKPDLEGALEFSNVSFAYPGRPDVPVLQEVSLRLQRNECVAIVGASGSGKSTIAALLQRLYEPNSGLITFGTTSLDQIDVRHLREHISVVSQNPNLFDASIAANIAYGGGDSVTDEDVQSAAKAANVHDFIMSLPRGYDTPVGENAGLISGGQAQRLAIARALIRGSNCKVLILDECTSALDGANQAAVLDSIRSAKQGRTTVMVTHKLGVMQMCDRIVVVDAGRVVEEGRYEELVGRRGGVFAMLASGGEWSG